MNTSYIKEEQDRCGVDEESPRPCYDIKTEFSTNTDHVELGGIEHISQSSFSASINFAHKSSPLKQEEQIDATEHQPNFSFVAVDVDRMQRSLDVSASTKNRPDLVSLMGTYIKTGNLTTPSNSKRGRIPKVAESSSNSDDSENGVKSPQYSKKTKKHHKTSASLQSAREILKSYSEQRRPQAQSKISRFDDTHYSDDSDANTVTNRHNQMEKLQMQNKEQEITIKELKKKLRAITAERDYMIETHETNKVMASDLRRALRYAKELSNLGTSRPTSSSSQSSASTTGSTNPSRPTSSQSGVSAEAPLHVGLPDQTDRPAHHHHLIHKFNDTGVVQLGKAQVFVNANNLSSVVNSSTSCTMLARNLLELVFSNESLASCSVRGRKANGFGKAAREAREPLYQIGVNAIIDFTIAQGKTCHWKIQDASTCVTAMGKRLNEIRHVIKLSGASFEDKEEVVNEYP